MCHCCLHKLLNTLVAFTIFFSFALSEDPVCIQNDGGKHKFIKIANINGNISHCLDLALLNQFLAKKKNTVAWTYEQKLRETHLSARIDGGDIMAPSTPGWDILTDQQITEVYPICTASCNTRNPKRELTHLNLSSCSC